MSLVRLHIDRSGRVTGTLKRLDTGAGLQPDSLYWSLWDVESGTTINSRLNVALTPVATYVDANGVFAHTLARADNVLADATKTVEVHRIRYYWIYNSAIDSGDAILDFEVGPDGAPTT
uniref:Uncharacterized protein n=1 Tax=viral metagenome TaxID=1070528 RepID=A0A6M3JBP8_9ZZZZ